MAAGHDVIYQATFFDGTFRGHADFLLRVDAPERPSRWGPYHYEIADTKLARHVKASAILQICSYVDQLERIQGVRPEWLHVALGGSARTVERLRVDDYMAYYRSARDRFLATLADETPATYPPATTYPEPVEHCDVCRWAAECATRRRTDDHLSLVAGISARQRRALGDARRRHARGAGRSRLADGAAARGRRRGRAGPGPRAGPDPARGSPRGSAQVRAAPAEPAARSRSTAGWRRSRRRRRATCSSTSRAIRTPSTTGSITCSACSTRTRRSPRSGRATMRTSSRSMASGAPSSAWSTSSSSASSRTRRCTSTTTRRTSRPPSSA